MATATRVRDHLRVGLVTGGGTGPELAAIFRRTLSDLSAVHEVSTEVLSCPHVFDTFFSALEAEASAAAVQGAREQACGRYQEFVTSLARQGVRVLFRTAMDAHTLYLARERLGAVKVDALDAEGSRLLLVRDCGQGFYTGSNDTGSPERIRRTCEFRRDWTEQLIDHALEVGAAHFGGLGRIDHVLAAYKFHLLDQRFAGWVETHARRRGVTIGLYQPDTMNRNLRRGMWRGNVLLIGANEWADIAHVEMIHRYGNGSHETCVSHTTYLAPGVAGVVEYQTVHGSADDIAGRGTVNPVATMRAAAQIVERHGARSGVIARMDEAIGRARRDGFATADEGGGHGTGSVCDAILERYRDGPTVGRATGPSGSRAEVLLIVDMQNDFCAQGGRFDELGLIDTRQMSMLGQRLRDLVETCRRRGVAVLFTKTVADEHSLPANVVERHRRSGRRGFLRSGSWGCGHFAVGPVADEEIVVKKGYDPFLGTDLQQRLRSSGVERVVLAGVFADVCVDAAARTAYQLGFVPTVLRDATVALERDLDETLSFMERYYGATVRSVAEWVEQRDGEPVTGGEMSPARIA